MAASGEATLPVEALDRWVLLPLMFDWLLSLFIDLADNPRINDPGDGSVIRGTAGDMDRSLCMTTAAPPGPCSPFEDCGREVVVVPVPPTSLAVAPPSCRLDFDVAPMIGENNKFVVDPAPFKRPPAGDTDGPPLVNESPAVRDGTGCNTS